MAPKAFIIETAKRRIETLMRLSVDAALHGSKYSSRYVELAEQIRKHYRIKKDKRFLFCKACLMPLLPGKTCTVKIASSKSFIIYKCSKCGHELKLHY